MNDNIEETYDAIVSLDVFPVPVVLFGGLERVENVVVTVIFIARDV